MLLVIVMMAPLALTVSSCKGPPMKAVNGRLPPCPSSPNCVGSQETEASHHVDPLPFAGDPAQAWARLQEIVLAMPRTQLVEDDGDYLHVEFRSKLFRFVDDVQFVMDRKQSVIEVRSASRLGHSDLGVNRRRMEQLQTAWRAAVGP